MVSRKGIEHPALLNICHFTPLRFNMVGPKNVKKGVTFFPNPHFLGHSFVKHFHKNFVKSMGENGKYALYLDLPPG